MNTVDIGLAQLSMHSTYETAGTKDIEYLVRASRAFFEAGIQCEEDGAIPSSENKSYFSGIPYVNASHGRAPSSSAR